MDLILATSNLHKIREFRTLLKQLRHIEIYSLIDFPDYIPPEEDGKSFEENAILKAKHSSMFLKKWSLADDSGLVVPALGGSPGIFSRRYAGENATDKENRKKLLKEMEGFSDFKRSAYFECSIALSSPEGYLRNVKGTCEGTITREERGKNGFGYDSVFLKYDYNQTFAEIDEGIKNRVSHRGKAFQKILIALEGIAS